jgi:hypothetical protein
MMVSERRTKTLADLAVEKAEEYTSGILASHPGLRGIYLSAFAKEVSYVMATRKIASTDDLTPEHWRSIKIFGHDAGMREVEKATKNKLKPRSTFQIWVNQGHRDAFTLAVVGDEALIEYTMPKGSRALRIVDAFTWEGYKTTSYRAVPRKWLRAMADECTEWVGN